MSRREYISSYRNHNTFHLLNLAQDTLNLVSLGIVGPKVHFFGQGLFISIQNKRKRDHVVNKKEDIIIITMKT